MKFAAIEGARGWLAWAVVICHIFQLSNLTIHGIAPMVQRAGVVAVMVFIIISGFVITHLIIERRERYRVYIIRRFMRIFPLFVVTCIIGYFATDMLANSLSAREPYYFADQVSQWSRSTHDHFWAHVFAHVTMLHGAIGDDLLLASQYAFNAPAWSISLEWQFYLLAPLIILLARQQKARIPTACVVAVLGAAYSFGLLGSFVSLSFLPGAAGYFAIGIVSRLAYATLIGTTINNPMALVALLIAMLPLGWDFAPSLIWSVVMMGLLVDRTGAFGVLYTNTLESRAALFFGARSYSIYLCHYPVLAFCHASIAPSAGRWETFGTLILIGPALTMIVAEFTYRFVERPGIAIGSRLARISFTTKTPAPEKSSV